MREGPRHRPPPRSSTTPFVILHLGLGAFHRAHQAAYLQDLAALGDRDWRLVAGNIRGDGGETERALIAQRGRYTLETVSPDGARAWRTIDAIAAVLPFTPDLAAFAATGADPATRIISMTVTEAGYFLSQDRALATEARDLAAELARGAHRTLYGALGLILTARMAAGAGPITLLSCDNLRGNGHRLASGLKAFLAAREQGALLAWCERNVTTPNAMVDRITPRPPPELAARVRQATGWADAAPVMAEDFRQWVIEDRFAAGRPALERVGVRFVDDVSAFEEAKIRILNASHSLVAWGGTLRGHAFIHEGARDPAVAAIARTYVEDAVISCLGPSPIDLPSYAATTLSRFANAALGDTNARVAADSWAKLTGFIAPTVLACLESGVGLESAALAPALFLRFMRHWADGTLPFAHADQTPIPPPCAPC